MSKFEAIFNKFFQVGRLCGRECSLKIAVKGSKWQLISLFSTFWEFNPFKEKEEDKFIKYWPSQTISVTLDEADKLFQNKRYLEVYELLNRLKFGKNVEVQWRIARALYELSFQKNVKREIRQEMIQEAYEIICQTILVAEENANVQKWYAVILDLRNSFQGLEFRLRNSSTVIQHMQKASELNPDDVTVQYMLGRWYYEMTNLSQLQRFIARILYVEPPTSTYEEAYQHLHKAEELKPGKYIPNTFLLGKTCLKLKEFYRAQFYLNLVSNLSPKSDYEKHCVTCARKLSKNLKKYDLGKDVLYPDFPFVGTE